MTEFNQKKRMFCALCGIPDPQRRIEDIPLCQDCFSRILKKVKEELKEEQRQLFEKIAIY